MSCSVELRTRLSLAITGFFPYGLARTPPVMLLLIAAVLCTVVGALPRQYPVKAEEPASTLTTGGSFVSAPQLDAWALNPAGDAAVYRTCRRETDGDTTET